MTKREMRKQIADLTERLTKLENMHANVMLSRSCKCPFDVRRETDDGRIGFYRDRQLTAREIERQSCHPQPKHVNYKCLYNVPSSTADTDRVSNVTLEELARLVIDGTPIRREEDVQAKRISVYTEDNTTRTTIIE